MARRLWHCACALSLAVMVVGSLMVPAATAGISGGDQDSNECNPVDKNGDGEYSQGETQECGGRVYGVGGNDGADLPPASEDHNTHQWNGYHWTKQSDNERKVIIRDSLSSTSYANKLGNVISDWGQSAKFKFVRQQAETDATTRLNCPMPTYYGRVRVCNHSDYTFSGAGIARIRYNSESHIQKGTVRVKNSVTSTAQRPLLCQEVGHTLGLDHRGTTNSCMYQDAGSASASPDAHDYEQLSNQTHHHGGEADTGGSLSDLDTGGGVLDGCTSTLVCSEVSSHGHTFTTRTSIRELPNGGGIVTVEWFVAPSTTATGPVK